MPYESRAQAAFFNIHRKELEKQGVDVDEWNQASMGMSLPEHAKRGEASKHFRAKPSGEIAKRFSRG